MERQTLRTQQDVLSPPQLREDERRLDAIGAQAGHDPVAAGQMLQIYRQDHRLETGRPVPPGGAR